MLSSGALLAEMQNVVGANPETMSLETLRSDVDGRAPSRCRALFSRLNGVRALLSSSYSASMDVVTVDLTRGLVPHQHQLRLFLNFGEHGRELITSQTALRLLRLLALGPDAAGLASKGGEAAVAALRRSVIKLVPLENAAGRARVEAGQLCLRKNGRGAGVDTNRNWGVHWGFKEKDYDPYEEAGGAQPFSEPEAVLLRDALLAFKPHAWVNVHSGMRALFMPFDHVAREAEGPRGDAMRTMLQQLRARHCADCVVGSGGASVGYLAHGTATDYIYVNLSVPVAFTWEIYGDLAAGINDCFRMFNPLSKQAHDETVDAWAAACAAMPGLMAEHPELPRAARAEAAAQEQTGLLARARERRAARGGLESEGPRVMGGRGQRRIKALAAAGLLACAYAAVRPRLAAKGGGRLTPELLEAKDHV